MKSFQECVSEYKKQLQKGVIQKAYRDLMGYVMNLRVQFDKKYPDFATGNMYHGFMDMTYFPIFPEPLRSRKLKIAIVLIHDEIRFDVWLVGQNKRIQMEYWELFKESGFNKYRIPPNIKGIDSIVEYTLVGNPDFNDLDALTKQIEKGTLEFIDDIEKFLSSR